MQSIITVLDRPQNPANVGAVVRAMRNLNFGDLRLVNPAPFDRSELLRYAHRCDALVADLRIHENLDRALADATYVVGTAALRHPDRPYTSDIRALAADLCERSQSGKVALLFGTEADGLDRAALDRCHLVASLPVNPDYPALNLAQSVLLFLYEVRMAQQGLVRSGADAGAVAATREEPVPAQQAELAQLFAQTEALLHQIDYFRYSPEAVLRELRQMVYRAGLSSRQVAMLLGMLRKVLRRIE